MRSGNNNSGGTKREADPESISSGSPNKKQGNAPSLFGLPITHA